MCELSQANLCELSPANLYELSPANLCELSQANLCELSPDNLCELSHDNLCELSHANLYEPSHTNFCELSLAFVVYHAAFLTLIADYSAMCMQGCGDCAAACLPRGPQGGGHLPVSAALRDGEDRCTVCVTVWSPGHSSPLAPRQTGAGPRPTCVSGQQSLQADHDHCTMGTTCVIL